MNRQSEHALYREQPGGGTDSIDFYIRNGRALHARAMRESLQMMVEVFRNLGRRRRRARATAWRT